MVIDGKNGVTTMTSDPPTSDCDFSDENFAHFVGNFSVLESLNLDGCAVECDNVAVENFCQHIGHSSGVDVIKLFTAVIYGFL
jgi:hypothetical protein